MITSTTIINKNRRLAFHILNKQITELEQLIKDGANVNERGPSGNYPLFYAVTNNCPKYSFKIAEILINNGADVNIIDMSGINFLRHAVAHHNLILHIAAIISDINLVKFVLNNGANINSRNRHGHSALELAILETRNDDDDYARNESLNTIIEILQSQSSVISLVGLCIIVVREHKINKQFLPEILFEFPKVI